MKRKEIVNLAKKIAKLEMIVQDKDSTNQEINAAQDEIMKLSSHVKNFEDLMEIDELVMEILSKNS